MTCPCALSTSSENYSRQSHMHHGMDLVISCRVSSGGEGILVSRCATERCGLVCKGIRNAFPSAVTLSRLRTGMVEVILRLIRFGSGTPAWWCGGETSNVNVSLAVCIRGTGEEERTRVALQIIARRLNEHKASSLTTTRQLHASTIPHSRAPRSHTLCTPSCHSDYSHYFGPSLCYRTTRNLVSD